MSNKIVAVFLLIVTITYGIQAWSYVSEGFSDILGARVFPILITVFMLPLLLILFFEQNLRRALPSRRACLVVASSLITLVIYAMVIDSVGYFIATTMVFIVYGLFFNASWWKTIIAGVVASFFLYALFVWALDMYLPVGSIFKGLF